MPAKLGNPEIRTIASEAYAYALDARTEYDRGYGAGVEDPARLLSQHDPAISDRLTMILSGRESIREVVLFPAMRS